MLEHILNFVAIVFAKLSPLAYLKYRFGLGQNSNQPLPDPGGVSLQDLPAEIRVKVWGYLSGQEHQAIKLQCKQFRLEINKIVGIDAILKGPKRWKDWSFSDEICYLRSFVNPESRRVEENIDWITNSTVRSLNLSRLTGLAFEPQTLICNGHMLHRLVVQLDKDMSSHKLKITEMLNAFNNLRIIHITCNYWTAKPLLAPTSGTQPHDKYRKEVYGFTQDILQSLVSKKQLKELSISVRVGGLKPVDFVGYTFMGILDEPTGIPIEYPSSIQVLKLKFPIFKNTEEERVELTSWKALLDRQTQLTELSVNLGFVHWTYFSNVIQNNEDSLRKLSLHFTNWKDLRTNDNWNQVVPDEHRLDWTVLLPNPQKLTALKVKMSSSNLRYYDICPSITRNFRALDLWALETLELQSVYLTPEDFHSISQHLQSLRNVKLSYFSTVGLSVTALTEIAKMTLIPALISLLTSNQLESLVVKDFSSRWCPKYLRQLISALPNYKTKWPFFGHYKIYENTCYTLLDTLAITRKPQNQLIDPILDFQ